MTVAGQGVDSCVPKGRDCRPPRIAEGRCGVENVCLGWMDSYSTQGRGFVEGSRDHVLYRLVGGSETEALPEGHLVTTQTCVIRVADLDGVIALDSGMRAGTACHGS